MQSSLLDALMLGLQYMAFQCLVPSLRRDPGYQRGVSSRAA